jgi:hypothetical protein
VGETFSTKNTLSTIVPRTQKRKQLTKQQEDKRAMDLTKSDDERKSGLNNQDPNLPDYEKSSSDEESVTYVSEAGAEPTETRASEKKADELGQKATVQTTSRTHCGYDWAIGEVVKVSLDNGLNWANATATVGTNAWSLAGQTLAASNTMQVKVVDAAGNDGAVSSQAYTLDTVAPTTTIATTTVTLGLALRLATRAASALGNSNT